MDEVPIVETKHQVLTISQVPVSLSSLYVSRKLSPIAAVAVVTKSSPDIIVTRRPIEK